MYRSRRLYIPQNLSLNTVNPVLNGTFIKRNFVLHENIFRSLDYHSIAGLNENLASAEKYSGPSQRIPTTVNLGFLDRCRYFFIQVAPQLSGIWTGEQIY
jgi:hypothetical protein